jgi:hypothetical protein
MAISVVPLTLATILTNNSGVEVPKATTVNPMTRSETFNRLAMDEAPSTRRPAPLINKTNPIIRKIYGNMAVQYGLSFKTTGQNLWTSMVAFNVTRWTYFYKTTRGWSRILHMRSEFGVDL